MVWRAASWGPPGGCFFCPRAPGRGGDHCGTGLISASGALEAFFSLSYGTARPVVFYIFSTSKETGSVADGLLDALHPCHGMWACRPKVGRLLWKNSYILLSTMVTQGLLCLYLFNIPCSPCHRRTSCSTGLKSQQEEAWTSERFRAGYWA